MKRAYADTSIGQVHYATAGDGPTLLCMHAANHSSRTFTELLPLLSAEYRVVAPDYPGFGNSDPLPDGTTVPDLAECMTEVLEAVGVRSAHVFGLHTGNKVGAAMAARTPGSVDRVILCGLPHSIIPDEDERDDVIRGRAAESMPAFPETRDGSHHLKRWADLHRRVTETWWDQSVLSGAETTRARIDVAADHVVEKLQMRGSLEAMYGANFAYDWRADLRRIDAPTLILELADADEVDAHGLQGERLTDLLADSTWTTVEDVDASVFRDAPETIADHVRGFLAGESH